MQPKLAFLELPHRTDAVWETLEEEHRIAALERLATLIARAAQRELSAEDDDE